MLFNCYWTPSKSSPKLALSMVKAIVPQSSLLLSHMFRLNLCDMIFSCIRIVIGSLLLGYGQEILPNYNSIPGRLNYLWWREAVEELDHCTFQYHDIWTILWFLCHWSKIRVKEIIDSREFIYVLVKNMRSFLLRCHDMMSMVRFCASTTCYTEFFKAKYYLKQ